MSILCTIACSALTTALQGKHCYYVHLTDEDNLCKIRDIPPNGTGGEERSRNSNPGPAAPKLVLYPGHHTEANPQKWKPANTGYNPEVVY